MGLPQLPGVEHTLLYTPFPSDAGEATGRYESVHHGTYNHHTLAAVVGDRVVVYWTNHADDENGPGQRILARWGVLAADGNGIDWGDPDARIIELVPPPVAVRRRLPLEDTTIDRRFVLGNVTVHGDTLVARGIVSIYHGWTDDLAFRHPGRGPVPSERFQIEAEMDGRFRYDMRWDLGPKYRQAWRFTDAGLTPVSRLIPSDPPPATIALTERDTMTLSSPLPPFDGASGGEDELGLDPTIAPAPREPRPRYEPGTSHLAANGIHGLAHRAEFRRRDGQWVILRDNLADAGNYYAAVASPDSAYPPGQPTNLYGHAMPAAGQLPDGRVWVIGNSERRRDFFLTLSDDGITFDRTWLVLHIDKPWERAFAKPSRGGPQYPFALPLGDSLWLFYSIGKEQIGVTRIPTANFK